MPWKRKWPPTPVFLPGKFHGQRRLAGYSPCIHSQTQLSTHVHTRTHTHTPLTSSLGFLGVSACKESTCSVGYPGSVPGSGRSPGEENDNPLQYSCLGNPMDRGDWLATVHGVTRVRHEPPPHLYPLICQRTQVIFMSWLL